MSQYAIRRESPNAKDERVKKLYIWQNSKGEFAFTPDPTQALKIPSMLAAMGVADAAKREDDMDGVFYRVEEL